MRLRTVLVTSVSIAAIAAMTGALIASRVSAESERAQVMLATLFEVERAVAELGIVAHESAVLPGPRVTEQWRARLASGLARLESAARIEGFPDTRALATRFRRMDELFGRLAATRAPSGAGDLEERRQSMIQRALLVESQQTLVDLSRIEAGIRAMARSSRERLATAFLTVTLVLGALAVAVPAMLYWRVTARLAALEAASRRIARDDYAARSNVSGPDELGTFGAAFDVMAERVESVFEDLAVAEAHERLILESAGDGILELDRAGRVGYSNPAACAILGRGRDELFGSDIETVWPAISPEIAAARAAAGEASAAGDPVPGSDEVTVLHRPDGRAVELESTISAQEATVRSPVVITFRDVSALRARERLLEALVSNVHQGIAIWAENGTLARWNPAYERMLPELLPVLRVGLRFDEIVAAAGPHRIQIDGTVDPAQHARVRMERHGTGERGIEIRRTNGRVHIIDEVPLPDGRMVEVFTDVSDITAREDELRRSNAELARFAHLASHDLQEPIRSVVGFCELLERRYAAKLDDDAREYIEFIVESSHRMQALVRDLLAYARIGEHRDDVGWLELGDLVDECLSDSRGSIEASGARVEVARPLPSIYGSRRDLGRVILNLIGNALKFRREVSPVLRIEAHERGADWVIEISDNGIGIAPEHVERIFEPFARLHTSESYEGTGIGLAVCKKAIEQRGGRIEVESRVGEGSRFRLVLPRDPGAALD